MADSIVKNTPVKTNDINLDVLINEFYIAVDLYKHEDCLNWSKVNHYLYITGGLGALLMFSIKTELDSLTYHIDPTILIAFLGIMSSLGFSIAITFGVLYLRNRKRIVKKLDAFLVSYNGVSILDLTSENKLHSKFSYREFSPTMLVLVLFPICIGFMWCIILISRVLY